MKDYILLKKNEEHRITNGHLWVFSNEIASINGTPESGSIIELRRYDQKVLGTGFYNPHSLIAFRLLSREREDITAGFFEQRIRKADNLRRRLYADATAYRMVYGESDFLPGLIIDRYNEFLSLQILSAGMECQLSLICDVLESMFHPKAIVARNDASVRALEHLPQEKKTLRGTVDETIVIEDDVKYKVDVLNGQKTGFYLDQRENRKAIRRYVRGLHVLDCFCNDGGFSFHAAKGSANIVLGIDASETAIHHAGVNAGINRLDDVAFEQGDVFDCLQKFEKEKKQFDVIILDPPSFTKSKKTIATALKGYREINSTALRLIPDGGFLITASCSHHITQDAFLEMVNASAVRSGRTIQLLEFRGAAPDHPVHPAMPETQYLKFAVFSVQ